MAHRRLPALLLVVGMLASCGGDGAPSVAPTDAGSDTTGTPPSSSAAPTTDATTESAPTSTVSSSAQPTVTTTAATSTTSSTTTAVLAADPAGDGFRSPTGNIHCQMTVEQARCSHHGDTPWKTGGALPHWARGVSFGFTEVGCTSGVFVGFDVGAAGRPGATCGDALVTAPDETLDYGERRTVGELTCVSQRFGMTCLNGEGNGFRLATNEIAMLYDRPALWTATSSPTAPDALAPTATAVLDEATLVETETGSAKCWVDSYEGRERPVDAAECRSPQGRSDPATALDRRDGSGADWSPDGRSCAGADFNGYYINDADQPEGYRVATFGCTTDATPLSGLFDVPMRSIPDGEAVRIGGVTCVSTGPAIACYNADGNGVLTAPDEISFFFDRDV